jgi:pyridoxine 5'-phosphate synthase PdxJ
VRTASSCIPALRRGACGGRCRRCWRCSPLPRGAQAVGLGVNAGHDLSQDNLRDFLAHVPEVLEVSIGHALIGEALYDGLDATVRGYLALL